MRRRRRAWPARRALPRPVAGSPLRLLHLCGRQVPSLAFPVGSSDGRGLAERETRRDRADLGRGWAPLAAAAAHARCRGVRASTRTSRRTPATTSSRSTPRGRSDTRRSTSCSTGHATFTLDDETLGRAGRDGGLHPRPERSRARPRRRARDDRARGRRQTGRGVLAFGLGVVLLRGALPGERGLGRRDRLPRGGRADYPDHAGMLYSLALLRGPGRPARARSRTSRGPSSSSRGSATGPRGRRSRLHPRAAGIPRTLASAARRH